MGVVRQKPLGAGLLGDEPITAVRRRAPSEVDPAVLTYSSHVGAVTRGAIGITGPAGAAKRAFDVAAALLGFILLAPLALLIALAIRISSQGPAVFRQTRIGRDGVPFEMFKFRTMFNGADRERIALAPLNEFEGTFKLRMDPRTTTIGRLLRRVSLDELPQLVNVLRGEMSLVGPRPLVPEEDALIRGAHRVRLSVPPGITGPWQALGPLRPGLSEMADIDRAYVETWSLWVDGRVLFRTVRHVLLLRGL